MRNAGWRVLNIESVEPGASVYLDTTTELLRVANAVIVVLSGRDSANALFETGLALGLGRPVLLIADDAAILDDRVPDRVLAGLPRIRARLGDSEALDFHVGAFLEGVMQSPSRGYLDTPSPTSRSERPKSRPSRAMKPSSQIEAQLLNSLEGAIEVEAVYLEPQLDGGRRFRPDFALWLRDTRQIVPNPVIVELASEETVRRGGSQRRLDQLRKYAHETGVGAVMLVEDGKPQPLRLLELSPLLFRVGLDDLQVLLVNERLVPEMVRARNMLAHSAG